MNDQPRQSGLAEQNFAGRGNSHKRLHITFVTATYPTPEEPYANIFTHRAIKALSSEINVGVIEFVSWKRGRRPFVSSREYDGVQVLSFACPRIPLQKAAHLNALIQTYFGKHLLQSHLRTTDAIHAASIYPPGFVARQWAKSVRKPCTTHAIGSDVNFLPRQVWQALSQPQWRFHGVACESQDMLRKITSLFPNSRNVQVVYRGVDTEEFSPPDVQANKTFANSPLRFLFLGGFHSWDAQHPFYNLKGGPLLLQVWQRIEHQIAPDVLIVGGPNTGTYRAQLQTWRDSLSRADAVSFLPTLHPDDMAQVIREADVVVIPSLFEGLPNLAKEAQACGRPVLGSDAGGIPEAVLHENTGIIVQRGDVDALSAGFLWFHVNKDKIETLGLNARNHMIAKFSWKDFSINMIDFFRAAIGLHESEL